MAVDLDRCQGCRACVEACKVENNTPSGVFWMYVFRLEEGEFPDTQISFLPRPCQHCDNPPCAKVCPVGARYQRDDGLVLTDYERCIGCRYCEVACPYGVNFFNWRKPEDAFADYQLAFDDPDLVTTTGGAVPAYRNPDHDLLHGDEQRLTAGSAHFKGVMEKCTFCVHRVEKGMVPACVETCPVGALQFGDIEDEQSAVSQFVRNRKHFKLLEELGTAPSVIYVGGTPPTSEAREIERSITGV
ncbi:MAG: 4Fe-4S dicluster domain-containing protein [Acidimicrobiia bacterium]|nr:4Fe-4S dicluster domain-containing protein [Acidimicrobiia bacterium]